MLPNQPYDRLVPLEFATACKGHPWIFFLNDQGHPWIKQKKNLVEY